MRSILQWLTGETLPPGDFQSSVSLTGISPGWALLLFVILAAATVWSYTRSAGDLSAGRRRLLIALRVASFALIVLFLLRPILSLRIEEPVRSSLLILFDNSRSMQIADERPGETDRSNALLLTTKEQPTRADLVKALPAASPLDLFQRLGEIADLKFESFGSTSRPLAESSRENAAQIATEAINSLQFDEDSTALGDALTETLTNSRGSPVSGVFLITDGASNAGKDPRAAAQAASEDRIPVYIYGTGVSQSRDLRVVRVDAPAVAFVGEKTEVRATIRVQGFAPGASAKIVLRDKEKILAEQTVQAGLENAEVVFEFTPDVAETKELNVVAERLEGEAQTDNNSGATTLRVVDEKVKLLYIEARPRWDFRYVVNALKDDRRVDLKCHVIAGDRGIIGEEGKLLLDSLPEAAELLSYQVVVLGDVPPDSLGAERMEALVKLVGETGGGLIFLSGPNFNPSAYRNTPLAPLLPVDLEPVADPSAYALRSLELQKLRLTEDGAASPLLALSDNPEENKTLWTDFAGVRWFAQSTRSKPTAETLLTTATGIPIVATQPYGRGQTLYFGTDETYRWRSKTGAKYFVRIWTQIIQSFALERLQGASDKIQLRAGKPVVFVGDIVEISGRVFTDDFQPLDVPRLEGEMQSEGAPEAAQSFSLDLSSETPGLYSGEWTPKAPGRYQFIPFRDRTAVTRFEVRSRDAELLNPAMDRQLLEQLASETKGRFLTEKDLAGFPDLLTATKTTIPRRKSIDIFASWVLLALAALLLFAEWTLRRFSQLK